MSFEGPPRGALHRATASGKLNEPPQLDTLPNEPKYDLATIVQLVGVRPTILWGWEQLGVLNPARVNDETGSASRRYSERDLVVAIWMRDEVLRGVSPQEAATRLLGAPPTHRTTSGPLRNPTGGPAHIGPLSEGGIVPLRSAPATRRLWEAGGLPDPSAPAGQPYGSPTAYPGAPAPNAPYTGGSLTNGPALGAPAQRSAQPSSPLGGYAPPTAPLAGGGSETASPSGRLTAGMGAQRGTQGPAPQWGGAWNAGQFAPSTGEIVFPSEQRGGDPPQSARRNSGGPGGARELSALAPQLVRAYVTLDTVAANRILNEALATRPIEAVCIGLLHPALKRVGDLWSRNEATMPEERFAMNYTRGVLYSIFHATRERSDAPMAISTCAPREYNDIHALTLAVFWRRAGLRVVYLGQDIEPQALLDEIRTIRPALVCMSVSSTQRLRSLSRFAKDVNQLGAPRPVFAFGGAIFTRNPELQRKVQGMYLGDDLATSTWHVTRLLGVDRNPAQGA